MAPTEFARTYAAMADEELIELARDSAELMDAAQPALKAELDRRGLELASPDAVASDTGTTCPGCGREVTDPLTCGSCSTLICPACGTPVELNWDEEFWDEEASGQESYARRGSGLRVANDTSGV